MLRCLRYQGLLCMITKPNMEDHCTHIAVRIKSHPASAPCRLQGAIPCRRQTAMNPAEDVEVLSFEYQALEYQTRQKLYSPMHLMLRQNGQVSVNGGDWHGEWTHSKDWRTIHIRFNCKNREQFAVDHFFEMIGDSHAWHGGPVRKRDQVVILTRRTKSSPLRLAITTGRPEVIWERTCSKLCVLLGEMRQNGRITHAVWEQLADELADGVIDYETERSRLAIAYRCRNAME